MLVKKANGGVTVEDDEDLSTQSNKDDGKKDEAKSSRSKRRKNHRRKYDIRAKVLQETAMRMGFVGKDEDEIDTSKRY